MYTCTRTYTHTYMQEEARILCSQIVVVGELHGQISGVGRFHCPAPPSVHTAVANETVVLRSSQQEPMCFLRFEAWTGCDQFAVAVSMCMLTCTFTHIYANIYMCQLHTLHIHATFTQHKRCSRSHGNSSPHRAVPRQTAVTVAEDSRRAVGWQVTNGLAKGGH
jgi:hypothetical protein